MSTPADILFITHNRKAYVEKTLPNLLHPDANLNVYWWDNASNDGVEELQRSFSDPRLVLKHRSPQNDMQRIPTEWFLENCRSDVIGKVDDDTLVPQGWETLPAEIVRHHPEAGMIGCWTYWPEDLERNSARLAAKLYRLGSNEIIRNFGIGGSGFLMRRTLAEEFFIAEDDGSRLPINRAEMSYSGYCSGWLYPASWAEHMDDPRSQHYLSRQDGQTSALSAQIQGVTETEKYLAWIKASADETMRRSFAEQLWRYRLRRSPLGPALNWLQRRVRRLA